MSCYRWKVAYWEKGSILPSFVTCDKWFSKSQKQAREEAIQIAIYDLHAKADISRYTAVVFKNF